MMSVWKIGVWWWHLISADTWQGTNAQKSAWGNLSAFCLLWPIVITRRPSNEGTPVTFSKFEEKKNTEKSRRINTMRKLFWGSPSPQKRQGLNVLSSIWSKKVTKKSHDPTLFTEVAYHVSVLWCFNIHFLVCLESSESFTHVLRAYQSLEPGDFTGFLKLLRSPSSQRLQSHCTAFLNTMEAHHVIICCKKMNNSYHFPVMSELLWS